MRYCILVTNTGAASVTVADPLPATMSYVPGSLRSGADIAATTATPAPAAAMAIRFDVVIN